MKKVTFTIAGLLIMTCAWTQNPQLDYTRALKIYNLSTFEKQTTPGRANDTTAAPYQYTNTSWQIFHPTIAVQWKTGKNNFHEIELTNLILGKTESRAEIINNTSEIIEPVRGGDVTTTAVSLRYEYILTFNKATERKLVPSVGFGVNPFYERYNYSPVTSLAFPSAETSWGIKTFLIPRITWFITSKLFLDANIPVCLSESYAFKEKVDDPRLPAEDRTTHSFHSHLFPQVFSGRIGIGLKL